MTRYSLKGNFKTFSHKIFFCIFKNEPRKLYSETQERPPKEKA